MHNSIEMKIEDDLISRIIGCAIEVHRNLGPGLLESAYVGCLKYELEESGLFVQKEVPMPIAYKDIELETGYRIDLMVESEIILEIKSVEALNDIHLAQILTYLKLADKKIGLLMNFNVTQLRSGIRRVINKYYTSP